MVDWEKTWVRSGWVREDGTLALPASASEVEGSVMAAQDGWVRARLSVGVDEDGESRVRVSLGRFALRTELTCKPTAAATVASPRHVVVYSDGSGGETSGEALDVSAGWAWTAVSGGDGEEDAGAMRVAEAWWYHLTSISCDGARWP